MAKETYHRILRYLLHTNDQGILTQNCNETNINRICPCCIRQMLVSERKPMVWSCFGCHQEYFELSGKLIVIPAKETES